MKRIICGIMSLFIMATVIGCGNSKTNVNSKAPAAPTITAAPTNKPEPNKSVTESALPKAYPADVVPIIDGGKVTDSANFESKKKVWINISTDKSTEEAYNYYKKVMTGAGNLSTGGANGKYYIKGEKNNYSIEMSIIDDPKEKGKTQIQINVTQK